MWDCKIILCFEQEVQTQLRAFIHLCATTMPRPFRKPGSRKLRIGTVLRHGWVVEWHIDYIGAGADSNAVLGFYAAFGCFVLT